MKCRKCGAEIPDNSLRCANCGIKVNMVCPNCSNLVPFGDKVCSHCDFELIKICSNCNSSNIYSATECRKCGSSLIVVPKDVVVEEQKIEETVEEITDDVELVDAFSSTNVSCPELKNATINTSIEAEVKKDVTEPVLLENETSQETEQDVINREQSIINISMDDVINDEKEEVKVVQEIEPIEEDLVQEESYIEEFVEETIEPAEISDNKEDDEEENLLDENIEIEPIEEVENVKTEFVLSDENPIQEDAVNSVVHLIKSSITKHVIAINGPEGSGKSAVLKQVEKNIVDDGYLFLYGSCTPLLQITTFGYFQDAFLRLMGFPPFTKSIESFAKGFKESEFASHFSFLSNQEMNAFLNLFYPSEEDKFENILNNREKIFELLEKVIKSFSLNQNLVLAIDNFELLDGASYDFIVYLLNKGYFTNRLKLVVAYQEDKSIQTYFDSENVEEEIFEMISLEKLSDEEMLNAIKTSLNIDVKEILDEKFLSLLLKKSQGNALRFEQEIALLFDIGYITAKDSEIIINEEKKPDVLIDSFEKLIKLRLNSLTPVAKNILFMAAIMGYRFSTNILCFSVAMQNNNAEGLLNFLCQEMFFVPVDNYTCEFKSLTLWKMIYQEAIKDILYKENAEKLYETLQPLYLSSNLQKLISCKHALPQSDAFKIWQETAKLCAKLGDTNLYVISLKQCLKLIEEAEIEDADSIKANMYEQIGKILCEKSPTEAIAYLSSILDMEIKVNNINKIIDISGYFIKSCYLSCNYFGAAEAVDAILSCIDKSETSISDSDLALIKARKLKALINIGNSEQIINLVNEEIIPTVSRSLYSEQVDNQYKILLIDTWLNSKITLVKAYILQGNKKAFDEIKHIKQFMERFVYQTKFYKLQLTLLEAFAYTIFGEIKKSNQLLNSVSSKCKSSRIDTELLSDWNLINVINRIFSDEKDGLKADLFELATFTNNINEQFTKNIIKLILGYILKEEGNTSKALEIFNDQITYFAKEKVAIGALLSWFLIVQMKMEQNDETALSTAMKSLEIAQSPKINNFLFIIYFQKCIAEIYLKKEDFSATKMYLEKSIMLAKQQDLKYQLIDLYIAYGEFMQEFMRVSNQYVTANVKMVAEMYENANVIARELDIESLIEKTQKYKNEYKTFCQLNSL